MMKKRRQGGWVLVLVLAVLLLLSLLVAAFFAEAADSATMVKVDLGQQVAMSHAEAGLQDGIRSLRAAQVNPGGLSSCFDSEVIAGTCASMIVVPASGPLNNGTTNDLTNQGGLQYQYVIYRRPNDIGSNGSRRFVIRSTGFYGYTTTANNLVTSIVEAEFDVGNNVKQDKYCAGVCGGVGYGG
jgi:hypothetical protein